MRIQQNEFPYHVDTRTNGRRFCLKKSTYKIFIRVLNEMVKQFQVEVHHFQLMSNHYHLKLFTPHGNIAAAMCFFNGRLARLINRQQGNKGHLWEKRYHAALIESDGHVAECVRYIYHNPVRARICRHPNESHFLSSFAFYAKGKAIPLHITPDGFFLALGRTDSERQAAFNAWINAPLQPREAQRIGKALRRIFYGSATFLEHMCHRYAKQLRLPQPALLT